MFASQPNLPDYLSFLAGIGIPPADPDMAGVFPTASGQATGGDNQRLTDSSQQWSEDRWLGYDLFDITQNVLGSIVESDQTDLLLAQPLANPIQAGDSYQILPGIVNTTLTVAKSIVNRDLALIAPQIYVLAVYNLAADRLINFAPDVPGQTFFADLRGPDKYNLMAFAPGVVTTASDAGTAGSLLNPEQMRLFTLQDLQLLRTFYGRQYLSFAQMLGTTLYGIS